MTISGFFEKDHDEIDAILTLVNFSDAKGGLAKLEEFSSRLERHIVWEEDILFPAVARVAPQFEQGPISVMLMEHVGIRGRKKDALGALRAGDGRRAKGFIDEMLGILGPHNMKEEHILYPACDQLLAGAPAEEILAIVTRGLSTKTERSA